MMLPGTMSTPDPAALPRAAFRSRHHPETAGRAMALAAVWAPLAPWVLAPMLAGVLAVLMRAGLGGFWLVAGITAVVVSVVFWQRVERTVVEATLDGGFVRLRSLGDVLGGRAGDFVPLLDARYAPPALIVTAGDQVRDLHAPDWPDGLRVALGEARRALHGVEVAGV